MRKKKCERCGKKIDKKFKYCPYCGYRQKKEDEFSGLIDENFEEEFNRMRMPSFGGLLGGIMKRLPIKDLMKDISKQMKEYDKEYKKDEKKPRTKRGGISVSIRTINGKPEIKVNPIGNMKIRKLGEIEGKIAGEEKTKRKKIKQRKKKIMTEKQIKRMQKLPKKEPTSKVRRLTDTIIYELDMPGVKEKNVFVNHLKNSIEIKALGKNKVYFKFLPISLPIKNYKIKDNKLILELKPQD